MEGDRWKVVVDPTRLAAAPVRYIKPASVPDAAFSDMAALWESGSAKSEEEAAHGLGLLKKSAGGGGGAGLGMMAAGTAVPLHKTSYDRPVAGLPTQPGRDVPMLGRAAPLPEHMRLAYRSPLTVTCA